MNMAERIAAHYGVRTVNVLTGFKFIGEQIGLLEKQGKEDSYIFGFEGSAGFAKMQDIMKKFHEEVGEGYQFAGKKNGYCTDVRLN